MSGIDAKTAAEGFEEEARFAGCVVVVPAVIGEMSGIAPEGHAVIAPVTAESPAWEGFAGVPLALAEVEEATGGEAFAEAVDQVDGELAFVRADGGGVPLGAVRVVDGDESRLAAHGEAHVGGCEVGVDRVAESFDGGPLLFRVGLGDAGRFVDALNRHLMEELGVAGFEHAGDGRGAADVGSAGEGDVAFSSEETGSGIETDPAGAGEIDLGPGVEVSEIGGGAHGAFDGLDIRNGLDEIAGDEAGGEAEMARDLNEKPGGIAAGAFAEGESFFAGLDTGFETDDVADLLVEALVDVDQDIDGAEFLAGDLFEPWRRIAEAGGRRAGFRDRGEVRGPSDGVVVGERIVFGVGFEEEIEGVEVGHFGDEVDFDGELGGGFGEDETCEVVGLRVLLPVDEVGFGTNLQRIREDRGAAMRRGAEAHYVRAEVGSGGHIDSGFYDSTKREST